MCQVGSYRTVVGSYRMVVLLTHFYQRKLFVYSINVLNFNDSIAYCILCGQIKGFNSSITAIMCQAGSYRTVVG